MNGIKGTLGRGLGSVRPLLVLGSVLCPVVVGLMSGPLVMIVLLLLLGIGDFGRKIALDDSSLQELLRVEHQGHAGQRSGGRGGSKDHRRWRIISPGLLGLVQQEHGLFQNASGGRRLFRQFPLLLLLLLLLISMDQLKQK